MKSTIFISSICLAGALLQGCTADPGLAGRESDDQDPTEAEAPREASSAPELPVDAKIAALSVPGGQVVFVDEGLTEPGGGIAFWELGDADLSYLLDEENGTALEVFLALAPEGTPPPRRLVEHHAEVARRVGGIPAQPRRLAVPFSLPEHTSFTNEGLNDGGSDTDKDCWGWAGTSVPYDTHVGYQSFDYTDFRDNFNAQYSQILGSIDPSDSASAMSDEVIEEIILGTTAAGHERAMAFCLSKAVNTDPALSLEGSCEYNVGRAEVVVERTTDAAYSSWSTADSILLTSFGHGARFRSNYTNSGGGARKYRLIVHWKHLNSENPTGSDCHDEIFGAWRSRQILTGPGGLEGG